MAVKRNNLDPAEVLRDGMEEATPNTKYKFPKGKATPKGKKPKGKGGKK